MPKPSVNRLTLREQVLDLLRTAIISGELRPGTVLTETDLADRYQVSRGTIREALRALQTAHMVSGDSRGTLQVHVPDGREIAEVFQVRGALESLAVRIVVHAPDHVELSEKLRAALPATTMPATFIEALDQDLAFHELLVASAGNEILLESWHQLEDRARMVLLSSDQERPDDLMSYEHHKPIVDAIENGDVETAITLIYEHMKLAAERWTAHWEARSES
jgi:DNA-binding GntR family transcriptional regulator